MEKYSRRIASATPHRDRLRWGKETQGKMIVRFKKLSRPSCALIHIDRGATVDSAKHAIASKLDMELKCIDIVNDKGVLVDKKKTVKAFDELAVVVHPEVRYVSPFHQSPFKDMINGYDDDDDPRVEMSCGHAITPDTLHDYCWIRLLCEGETEFICASNGCSKLWAFPEVVTKARLSNDEKILFEIRMNANWEKKSEDVSMLRQCPSCHRLCQRKDTSNSIARCIWCKIDFCWYCYLVCSYGHKCDDNITNEMLQNCERKTIGFIEKCPSVRACPTCGRLIEHKEACKQMTSCKCGVGFCFICLCIKQEGRFKCGDSYDECVIAPIQKVGQKSAFI